MAKQTKQTPNSGRKLQLELASIATVLRQIFGVLKELDKHLVEATTPARSGPMPGSMPGPSPLLAGQWKRQDGNIYSAVGTRNEPTNADNTRGNIRSP